MSNTQFINTFKRRASLLQDIKLFINKDYIRSFEVKNKCWNMAKKTLGNDFNFLYDEIGKRKYLHDVFGKDFELFISDSGDVEFDQEHTILLYNKLEKEGSRLTKTAIGLLYYIAGEQLDREFEEIVKTSIKGYIAPAFDLSPQTFRWKRCNHILRKYAMYFTKPEGYKAYYFEKSNFAQIAYLCTKGKTLKEAEQIMKSATGGIFYSYLPKNIENMLAYAILGGQLGGLNGMYASEFSKDSLKLSTQFDGADYSVFNMNVKPIMIEFMGMTMTGILEEMGRNKDISPTDAYIYHVSPYRFGILVKDSLDLNYVLPQWGKYFNPVVIPNLRDLVFGLYL